MPESAPVATAFERDVPRAFVPLLAPRRYKGAYGGRGGSKSHFFAEEMIERCFETETRAVCLREVQNTLKDSVKQLLEDKIQKFGLGWFFEVLEGEIRGANGSIIIFRGMQSFNAESIKSLEGYDIAWVEEAQTLSEHSLKMLRPTIRKPGSELWFSWNPRYRTDPVDVFFRKRPMAQSEMVSVFVNWPDNPWFPEVLDRDRRADVEADPEDAEHVWGGGYAVAQGAILARLVDRAEREGRINDDVDFFRDGPAVEISSDIGKRDTAAWWFWQRRVGGFALIDYDQDSGLDADEWSERLMKRLGQHKWPLGMLYLPHDAKNRTFQARYTARETMAKHFSWERVKVVPLTSKLDRINAGRTIIKTCEFNKTRCALGLDGLRAWEYEWNPETSTFSKEPLHNWASHPSDGYTYGCQVMEGLPVPDEPKPEGPLLPPPMTFDALMKQTPKQTGRI